MMFSRKGIMMDRESQLEALISARVAAIEAALAREPWLPFSLRGLLAAELPEVLRTARDGKKRWRRKVSRQLLVLAQAAWDYGPSPLESKTVASLRALDLEVNGSLIGDDGRDGATARSPRSDPQSV